LGSVNVDDIAALVSAASGVAVDADAVTTKFINKVGLHVVTVALGGGVSADVTLQVTAANDRDAAAVGAQAAVAELVDYFGMAEEASAVGQGAGVAGFWESLAVGEDEARGSSAIPSAIPKAPSLDSLLGGIFGDDRGEGRGEAALRARADLAEAGNKYFAAMRAFEAWTDAATSAERGSDREAYDLALAACAKGGLGKEAEGVLRALKADVPGGARGADLALALAAQSSSADALRVLRNAELLYGVAAGPTQWAAAVTALGQQRNGDAGFDASLQVAAAAKAQGLLSLEAAAAAVFACGRLGDWEQALAFLTDARRLRSEGLADPAVRAFDMAPVFTSCLAVLNQARESQRLVSVFALMDSDDVDPSGVAFGLAISANARLGQRNNAAALQESLRLLMEAHELRDELDQPVDARAYLAVMDAHGRAKEPFGASEALALAVDAGVADERCFETAVRAAAQSGAAEQALAHVRAMRDSGLTPSVDAYNQVIAAYEGAGRLRDAGAVLKEMQALGYETNAQTYCVAIRAAAGWGDFGRAYALLEEMKAEGLKPTVEVYAALAKGCAKIQSGRRAVALLAEMGLADLEPNLAVYNAVLQACVERAPSKAVEVLTTMAERAVVGDRTTVWCACRLKDLAAASEARAQEKDEEDDEDDDEDDEEDSSAAAEDEGAPAKPPKRLKADEMAAVQVLHLHYGPGGNGLLFDNSDRGAGQGRGGSGWGGGREFGERSSGGRGGGREFGERSSGGRGGGREFGERSSGGRGSGREFGERSNERSGGRAEAAPSDDGDFLSALKNLMKN
jgi:pentatricopeptide repeat protein